MVTERPQYIRVGVLRSDPNFQHGHQRHFSAVLQWCCRGYLLDYPLRRLQANSLSSFFQQSQASIFLSQGLHHEIAGLKVPPLAAYVPTKDAKDIREPL
jgi:hypothetical protein